MRVSVNGVQATITADASVATSPDTSVEWSVEVTLEIGDNEITVSVEDSNGDVTDDADTGTVRYVEVPTTFSLDPDGTRLVGWSYSVTNEGFKGSFVEHNYATGKQTIFRESRGLMSSSCLRAVENEVLSVDRSNSGYALLSYNLTTGQESVIATIPPSALSGGEGFEDGYPGSPLCDSTHSSAYMLVNHFADDGTYQVARSRILEIDLDTAAVTTLADSLDAASSEWLADMISLADDQIVASRLLGWPAPLTSISLEDGATSNLTPGMDASGLAVQPDLDADRVYVATIDGIDEIDLSKVTRRNISPVAADNPLSFAQNHAMGLDAANNRLIVGDSGLDMLIAVDIASGERSEFLSRSVGTGPKMLVPRRLALSSDGRRAYALDDGGRVGGALVEIDLRTGNRRSIHNLDPQYAHPYAAGMAYDEPGNRVFVAFWTRIVEIDLATERVREVANVDTSPLGEMRELMLDSAHNRLLIGDQKSNAIFAMDLTARDFSLVSQDGVRGDGPPLATPISFAGPTAAGELYVADYADDANRSVMRVNLASGDRELIDAPCNPANIQLSRILYNAQAHELLMLAGSIQRLDLDSGECTRVPGNGYFDLLQIQNASADQLVGTTWRGELVRIDRKTGEFVYVSR